MSAASMIRQMIGVHLRLSFTNRKKNSGVKGLIVSDRRLLTISASVTNDQKIRIVDGVRV